MRAPVRRVQFVFARITCWLIATGCAVCQRSSAPGASDRATPPASVGPSAPTVLAEAQRAPAKDDGTSERESTEIGAHLSARLEDIVARHQGDATLLILDFYDGDVLGRANYGLFLDTQRRVPASTVKPLLSWYALESGVWPATRAVTCQGTRPDAAGNRCFHEHGELEVGMAIATSCNMFFFPMVEALGREGVKRSFDRVGFDTSTMVEQRWQATALGHGGVAVSALELARAYRQLGQALARDPQLAPIRAGLEWAVTDALGSARVAAASSVSMMGKTGTARVDEASDAADYYSWFVALAPVDRPEVVAVASTRGSQMAAQGAVPLVVAGLEAWTKLRGE